MAVTRRDFIKTSGAAAAALGASGVTGLTFGQGTQGDIIVVVFLRGGMDGLTLLAPVSDANYVARRPTIRIRDTGTDAGLTIPNPTNYGNGIDFRLNPRASALRDLYTNGSLAMIHACGLTNTTRSHFDAQQYMESGNPAQKMTTGWLARHVGSVTYTGTIPVVAAQGSMPAVLLGSTGAVISNLSNFALPGDSTIFNSIRSYYTGSTAPLFRSGLNTLNALESVNAALGRPPSGGTLPAYTPSNGAVYPTGGFGDSLITVARMIKMGSGVGLQAATVDFGGWDHHETQGSTAGRIGPMIETLSRGLMAFYTDLQSFASRLTVVVMSEFGRTLRENQSQGTDHGRGNVVIVLGGNVNGGRLYGTWPGLATGQVDGSGDMVVANDYRQVLAEIVMRRLGNPRLSQIFPGLTSYSPFGILRGSDLPVQ